MTTKPQASFLRRAAAGIFDFITIFAAGGYGVAKFTGDTTENGFQLNGLPALVLFIIIAAYFYLGWKILGGTIWQRIFGAR